MSGLVQSQDEAGGRWRFAHGLVLDAAYRGLSKGQRAELHERLAEWLAVEDAEQADVGESVARHLERALHLREELGLRDDRSAALASRAGELFAVAGSRAFAILDFVTTRDLWVVRRRSSRKGIRAGSNCSPTSPCIDRNGPA